ncbi:MAG: tyrosine-type recombinase/integrase [Gammaproteobacteria bacterium]|nr:tyrosine-type recombinase/integrase [Gammaproteobacteria bacterium]
MASRYPKKGKGSQWTTRELESIKKEWAGDTVNDGGGLSGEVRYSDTNGVTIRFRYAFKWEGKIRWHYCGLYPVDAISNIRKERDRARALLADGVNPTQARQAERIEQQEAIAETLARAEQERTDNLAVADLFAAWIRDGVARKDGNAALVASFERDVLPAIGNTPVRELSERDLLELLRKVKARGSKTNAQRGMNRTIDVLSKDIGQMLRWAERRQPWRLLMAENGNPADLLDVSQLIDDDYQTERDRVLSAEEIRELWQRFEQLEADYKALPAGQKAGADRPVSETVQCAIWICLSTLCRIGETLQARWEHIDLDAGTWHIPAANTKGHKGKRKSHDVTLSRFAVEQFRRLHSITGHTPFCFPNRKEQGHICLKTVSKRVGDRQVMFKLRSKPLAGRRHDNSLVLASGKRGEWTPHDMRRTGASLMQALGISLDVIDRCQNHVLAGSKVRRAYLHHDYQQEMADAWHRLGERLQIIIHNSNVVSLAGRREA